MAMDAAGNIARPGQTAITMQELAERVARANNAARAHGLNTEYVLEVRPGAAPNTSQVRVVSRPRAAGVPVETTGRLYTGVETRTQAEATQIQGLLARDRALRAANPAYPGSQIELQPNGQIRINGQIDIHPDRMAEIAPADQDRLLQATQELAAQGGRFDRVSEASRRILDNLASSGTYRLRFAHSRARAEAFLRARLTELGLNPDNHPLLRAATEADLNRAYDLVSAGAPPAGAPNLQRQATAYALRQARDPSSIREFVEHYEFYTAEFMTRAQAEIARLRAAGTPNRRQAYANVEAALGDPANLAQPSAAGMADVAGVYQRMRATLNGRFGQGSIRPGLSPADTVDAVQAMNDVTFASESAAVYHTRKHLPELPAGERARSANDVQSYLDSAVETVKRSSRADAIASARTAQDGSGRSYAFTRQIGGQAVTARVFVTNEGRVLLLTYQ